MNYFLLVFLFFINKNKKCHKKQTTQLVINVYELSLFHKIQQIQCFLMESSKENDSHMNMIKLLFFVIFVIFLFVTKIIVAGLTKLTNNNENLTYINNPYVRCSSSRI